MGRHSSFARFVAFPENKLALTAVHDLAHNLQAGKSQRSPNPLFLHGPAGTGKTCLATALVVELAGCTNLTIQNLAAADFREPRLSAEDKKAARAGAMLPARVEDARGCDLLIVEDLQHLPLTASESLVQIIDHRQAHQRAMLFTASAGPRRLVHRGARFPARLTGRLATGLVVALEPLQAASRERFLGELAQRRQLALPHSILEWLARRLTGGGRQLEGAIGQLEALSKMARQPLDLKAVKAHFRDQVEGLRPTVERIAARVGSYFRIEPAQLQSRHRYRNILLPRQISMYLARQLTALSLERIGAYFGRDHTTVLHACRRVEEAMQNDVVLSGAVRQIHAELG